MSETPYLSFVVYDAQGKEVDWIDPYLGHSEIEPGVYEVLNPFGLYDVEVPEGGRYELKWVIPDDGVEVERR